MDTNTIITALTKTPRQTAKELGVTVLTMHALAEDGKVVNLGHRKTGKRGRPSIEWAIPGTEVEQDTVILEDLSKLGLTGEEPSIIEYIDAQVTSGHREQEDIKMLMGRRNEIARTAKRRLNR